MTMTDEELMLAVKDDDQVAFDELVKRFGGRVYGLSYRYLRDRTAAEDVVQETFLRLFTHRKRYVPTGKFSTWVLTIAANLCRSIGRRQSIVRFKSMDEENDEEGGNLHDVLMDEKENPVFVAERNELMSVIEKALQSLPEERRMALILSQYEGLDYKAIGKVMQCSEGTVKSRVFRARAELSKILGPFLPSGAPEVM